MKAIIPTVTSNITKSMMHTTLQSLPVESEESTPPFSLLLSTGLLNVRKNCGNSVLYDGGPLLSTLLYGGGG